MILICFHSPGRSTSSRITIGEAGDPPTGGGGVPPTGGGGGGKMVVDDNVDNANGVPHLYDHQSIWWRIYTQLVVIKYTLGTFWHTNLPQIEF